MNAPGYLSAFTTEHKVEAAQRVIDSGRTVAGCTRSVAVLLVHRCESRAE